MNLQRACVQLAWVQLAYLHLAHGRSFDELFSGAACQAACLQHELASQNSSIMIDCEEKCRGKRFSFQLKTLAERKEGVNKEDGEGGEGQMEEKPFMHCRGKNELAFKWNPPEPKDAAAVFVVDMRTRHDEWIPVDTTRDSFYVLRNLSSSADYRIRLWRVDAQGVVTGPFASPWAATADDSETPKPVEHVWTENVDFVNEHFLVTVKWTPNEDRTCFYDLVWFNDGDSDYSQLEIREPGPEFAVRIGELEFERNYSIGVMAKNQNWDKESSKMWAHVEMPSCLDVYANLTHCLPATPKNLSASETEATRQTVNGFTVTLFDVHVRWSAPDLVPDYYSVALVSLVPVAPVPGKGARLLATVPGGETAALLRRVNPGLQYQVSVRAVSAAGSSAPALLVRQVRRLRREDRSEWPWVLTAAAAAAGVSLAVLVIAALVFAGRFLLCQHRARRQRHERRCKYFEDLEEKAQKGAGGAPEDNLTTADDEWELRPDQLILQCVLGEGAFGLVRKGWLCDEYGRPSTKVAIKLLKDAPTIEHAKQFSQEIEIMKSVGPHPHLVSILGCCTRPNSDKGMMLVVEYCALGDLQNYLRTVWDRIASRPTEPAAPLNIIVNKLYELQSVSGDEPRSEPEPEPELEPGDLLSFARQICIGMEFLSSLRVIHRDLAARNVLVCADRSVKVADFGLSRDVYRDNAYRKSGNGKLPIRWMAIESLTHQLYTSQSDVWSFGILLWEIMTLGGDPYPSIPTNSLLKLLRAGYRMEKPSNCTHDLYIIMVSCWRSRPKDRPTFTELRKSLDRLLESVTTAKYLDLNLLFSSEFMATRPSRIDPGPSLTRRTRGGKSNARERYVCPAPVGKGAPNRSTDVSVLPQTSGRFQNDE